VPALSTAMGRLTLSSAKRGSKVLPKKAKGKVLASKKVNTAKAKAGPAKAPALKVKVTKPTPVKAKPFAALSRGQVVVEERVTRGKREYLCGAMVGPASKRRFSGDWVAERALLDQGVAQTALASVARGGVLVRKLEALAAKLERVADWWAPEGDGWKLSELEVAVAERLAEAGCVVCQDELAIYKAHPCGHRIHCQACHDVVIKRTGPWEQNACPVCRRALLSYRKVGK